MAQFVLSAFADEAVPSLDGQLEALKRHGIRFVELRNINGKGLLAFSKEELHEFSRRLRENGISLSAVGSPIGKIAIDAPMEPHLEDMKRYAEAAHILGTERIRMFSFFLPPHSHRQYRGEVLRRMNLLLDTADSEGVACYHENEKDIYGDRAEYVLDLHRQLGHRLHGVFDPANYIQCGERPMKIYGELAPYIDYLHLKDALLADGAVVPAGKGEGQLAELLDAFAAKEGPRFLTIEPHLSVFEGLSSLQPDELTHHYQYASAADAFAAGVSAVKELLEKGGHSYE